MPDDESPEPAPGYPLADTLALETHQLRVFFDDTRMTIIDLLADGAATTTQIAAALGIPKGTAGYHLKTLEDAGLVTVVRTEKVRAIEAKYYGRTARTFLLGKAAADDQEIGYEPGFFFRDALDDIADVMKDPSRVEGKPSTATIRHVRIPDDRAAEWVERLHALMEDFITQPRGGDTSYGFVFGLYPTVRPVIAGQTKEENT